MNLEPGQVVREAIKMAGDGYEGRRDSCQRRIGQALEEGTAEAEI